MPVLKAICDNIFMPINQIHKLSYFNSNLMVKKQKYNPFWSICFGLWSLKIIINKDNVINCFVTVLSIRDGQDTLNLKYYIFKIRVSCILRMLLLKMVLYLEG